MIIIKLVMLALAAFVLPLMTGMALTLVTKQQTEYKEAYLTGVTILLALFYLWIEPQIKRETSLTEAASIITRNGLILTLLVLGIILFLVYKRWKSRDLQLSRDAIRALVRRTLLVLGVSGFVATLSLGVRPNGTDYTGEIVNTMYFGDTLYDVDPLTGKAVTELTVDELDYLQDLKTAPFAALYGVAVSVTRILPAKFVSIILPFLVIPIYVCTYLLWGEYLFPKDKKKQILFNILVWVILGMGLVQNWDVAFDIFANPWNGETIFFMGILPFSILLMLKIQENIVERKYYAVLLLLAFCFSAKLLYQYGLFIQIFAFVVFGIYLFLRRCGDAGSRTTA